MDAWKTRSWGLSLVLAVALAGSARAQSNAFLKLGDIGNDGAAANGMEILGIAWSGPTMNMGPMQITAATPPPDVRTLTVMKRVDKSSPKLAQALAKGTVFPEATLLVPEGRGSRKYMEFKLTQVMISGYQTSGSQERPTESLSLNFAKIAYAYPQKEPGGPLEVPYDLKAIPKGALEEGRPAAPAAADLLPLNGLTLATTFIPWGQTATIAAKDASSKQGGRCFFRYRYETGNQGALAAGATTNRTHLNAANGPALADDALPGLAAADEHTASGLLPLKEGTWTLYVHVDDDLLVAEGDEQNNLRRVGVRVEGSCGRESTGKTPSVSSLAVEEPSETATPTRLGA